MIKSFLALTVRDVPAGSIKTGTMDANTLKAFLDAAVAAIGEPAPALPPTPAPPPTSTSAHPPAYAVLRPVAVESVKASCVAIAMDVDGRLERYRSDDRAAANELATIRRQLDGHRTAKDILMVS